MSSIIRTILSIPFMGYKAEELGLEPEEALIFQFPLWDTAGTVGTYTQTDGLHFQFPLWDTYL